MTEPFVGEIRIFAGSFAPKGWAFCDGQLLATSQNDALFSLLGTIYGGDGRTTFGLPDMRGRLPIHQGTGPGLTRRNIGAKFGHETETVNLNQTPSHSHNYGATSDTATKESPTDNVFAAGTPKVQFYLSESTNPRNLMGDPVANTGGSQPHTNLMPALCLNFIIALFGIYPSRQ